MLGYIILIKQLLNKKREASSINLLLSEDAAGMERIQFKKDIPVRYRCNVLVAGGGPAGFSAAVAAARGGANVLLVEKNGFCGGMATAGLVAPFMTCYDSGGDKQLIRGIFEETVRRMVEIGGALYHSDIPTGSEFTSYIIPGHIHVTPFEAEAMKLICDRMLTESGVHVLYHAAVVDVIANEGKIDEVILSTAGGLCAAQADVVVDCTGDGDVAAYAGVPYIMGNGEGRVQPATMFFRIGNVDTDRVNADIEANRSNFYRKDGVNYRSFHWRVAEARAAGDWNLKRVSIGMFRSVKRDEWNINTSRVMNVDGTDSESLTRAEKEGREQVDVIFRFLKKYVPGCENARMYATGSTIGIRETRHIEGIRTLTADDLVAGKIPDDSIMLGANAIDIHGKFGALSQEYITLPPGTAYGVPYGCLVPRGTRNLLVAGRCISATSDAAGAIRVMPPCMALGEAAGRAAAMASESRVSPSDIDVGELRLHLDI